MPLSLLLDPAFYPPPILGRLASNAAYRERVCLELEGQGVRVMMSDEPGASPKDSERLLYAFLNAALAATLRERGEKARWPELALPRAPGAPRDETLERSASGSAQ
jgi:hypothetical protein